MRDKLLKVVLTLVGLGIVASSVVLISALANPGHAPISMGDQMILGIYLPFGVFLLLAIRNPSVSRNLILAVGWSWITHALVMTVQSSQHGSLSARATELVIVWAIGIALLALAPRRIAPAGTVPAPLPHSTQSR